MPPEDLPDPVPDPVDPQPAGGLTLAAFTKLRRDKDKQIAKWKAEAGQANTRYETAAQANVDLTATHATALADQQHEFERERAFATIGAAGEESKSDRGYMQWKYNELEASVPEGAPEGTEPAKPSFAEWLPGFVKESQAMAQYHKAPEATPKTPAPVAKHGAVKRNAVTDPAQQVAPETSGSAEAPLDQAAFLRLDPAQQRASFESSGMLEPRPAAE